MKISKSQLVYPYILLLPFVSAFALTGVLPLPFVYSVLLGGVILFFSRFKLKFGMVDISILFLFCSLLASLFVNIGHVADKMVMHTISWLSVIVFMFYVPRIIVNESNVIGILRVLRWGYLFICIFCIVELLLSYLYSIDINSYIPRPIRGEYDAKFNGLFVRARATFFESGHCGMFLGSVLPFVIIYDKISNKRLWDQIIVFVLSIFAALACISSAYFIFVPVSFVLGYFLFKPRFKFIFIAFCIGTIVLLIFHDYILEFWNAIYVSKFQSSSMTTRYYDNMGAVTVILNSNTWHLLFGHGPGSYSYLGINPATSGYITMLLDLGLIGLTSFVSVFVSVFIILFKNRKEWKTRYYTVSLMIMSFYLISINTYYFSFMWFLLVLMINKKFLNKIQNPKHLMD
jgi:hypothetical protein